MNNQYPFREHHLYQILTDYEEREHPPLDLCISRYFRAHKALGAKDRAFIADTAYELVRWQGLLDFLAPQPTSWEGRLETLKQQDLSQCGKNPQIPNHIKASFPQQLYDLIINTHGAEKGHELCLISNEAAPTTIRANTLKTTREQLLKRWKSHYLVSAGLQAPNAIIFHKKINFFILPEFKEGLFEVQDEGSQLLSQLMRVEPQQQVMDYCSGSGGKTLAFAPHMQGSGQIFLHDVRPSILMEAKQRLRRAGIQNAQVVLPESAILKKLKKQMDWVLVDAPCSGTGTMRRNPDMKWRFTEETLLRLQGQQRTIFEKALSFVKAGGRIVYGTCSILKEENQEQMDHFIKTYDLVVEGEPLQILPSKGSMDGFFGVVFKKQ